jgi:hypothetical protein
MSLHQPFSREGGSGDWMRLRLFKLLLLTIVFVAPAFSQNGQCGFIKDPNLQAQCRASTGSGSGQCGFIRDKDLQSLCRAQNG